MQITEVVFQVGTFLCSLHHQCVNVECRLEKHYIQPIYTFIYIRFIMAKLLNVLLRHP